MTTTQPPSDAPTGAGPGRPGRSRPAVIAVAVDCYAGHRGDETPRRFIRGDQLVEILAVVERWRTPDHRYFMKAGAPVGRTSARAQVTAFRAERLCDKLNFVRSAALGCIKVLSREGKTEILA